MDPRPFRKWTAFGLVALALCCGSVSGQEEGKPAPPAAEIKTPGEAQALVRRVIEHQMAADEKGDGPAFMFVLKESGKRGVSTKELVETKDGLLARLIAVGDRPPTAEERRADDERLDKLRNDPQVRAQKAKQQKEDDQRTRKMVRALPDAFSYEPDGTVPGPKGDLVRLKFRPNPDYEPPSREMQVFQGMEGHMIVDPRAQRLAEINAHLFRDVNFGWGILGRLDKGGEFAVRQSDVTGNDDWQITEMHLKFDGKVLIFKSLHIRQDVIASGFRVVPRDLTLAQGLELLRKQEKQSSVVSRQSPE